MFRKKWLSALALTLIVAVTAGCSSGGRKVSASACLGIVETNNSAKTSRIIVLDENFREEGQIPLNYASLVNPVVYDNELYVVPQGNYFTLDETIVLSLNLSTLEKTTYDFGIQRMHSVCVDENCLYACSYDTVAIYNKKDKSVITNRFQWRSFYGTVLYKGNLYVAGLDAENGTSRVCIWVFNQEMEVVREIDITQCGIEPKKFVEHNGNIYFTNDTGLNGSLCKSIFEYSIEDDAISSISLEQNYPSDIIFHKNQLIVSHFNSSDSNFGGISFYNMDTKEMKYTKLDHGAETIRIKGNYLFMMNREEIFEYRMDGTEYRTKIREDLMPAKESPLVVGFFTFGQQ